VRPVYRLAAVVGLAVALAAVARPQDGPFDGLQPHYWPRRTTGIPVDTQEILKLSPKPTHLQLYYSFNRGPFQKGAKLPPNGLDVINGEKKGFRFEAPRDGDYEFAVQLVFSDDSVSPRTESLAPEIRTIIDTTPPRVQLAAVGNGVEWVATDDNLDPRSIRLECRWPTSSDWTPVAPATAAADRFRPADNYAWKMPPGKVLEARVLARDRAGNEGYSPVVRVPGDAGTAVGLTRPAAPWVGGTAALPQPRIDYVNTLQFDVDYTVQRMGRSGVQAAHLFVLKEQGNWELVKRFPFKMMPDDKEPHSMSLPYTAAAEGTYGFYIIPESGAGKRADDPKKDDPPMVLVVVDTRKPVVQITGVQVKPGGTRGPLVEINWTADDANLMPQPVSLEWSLDKSAARWNEIKYRLDNNLTRTTGRYTWEVPDDKVWKFFIRARAVDKAANTGEDVTKEEVIVDLEKPSATIDRIRGGGVPNPAAPKPPQSPPTRLPQSDTPAGGP
jgi:hypothetical protein